MHIEDRIKKIDYESEIDRVKNNQCSVSYDEYIARCEEILWLMKCRDKWAELYSDLCDEIEEA